MQIVRVCGPVAKVVREVADKINGPDVTAPEGVMVAGTLFLISDDPLTPELVRHELTHTRQAKAFEPRFVPSWGPLRALRYAWGWARFYTAYSIEHARHGYWDNHFEVEAREAEAGP